MSTEGDTTRIVRSWLMTDEHESADRVLDAVLQAVDTTPQRRAGWLAWRLPTMNTAMKLGLAAVVVAIAAVIGVNYLGSANVGGPGLDDATPTATPSPTPDPTPDPTPRATSRRGRHSPSHSRSIRWTSP